jgi:probable HAF family extracellular repeat protein
MRVPSSFLPTFRTFLSASLLSLGLISSCLAQTAYTITDLGTLGGAVSVGLGLNASGQVTGYSDTATGGQHAFLYSGGAMTDLGTLGCCNSSAGQGINDSGQVTGYSYATFNANHAFLYSGGVMTDVGTLGGAYSLASGINNSGQITGYADTGGGPYHAFLYSGSVMTDLGTLPYDSYSEGFGINNSGQVTGWSLYSEHAFLYSSGSMADLGTLGGFLSIGVGINDSGQVAGYSSTSSGALHAFLFSGGSMADLGTLGGSTSVGLGISTSGQVVGYSYLPDNVSQRAFEYTPRAGMVDLNTLLPSGSGWALISAYGINDAGQITGWGFTPDGSTHAFLISPVVPFSAFAAHLEIGGAPPNSFEINGTFSLGASSNGIDPVSETVTLNLGTFSITLPKNSFRQTSNGIFDYEGKVGGVALEFRIASAITGYTFKAEGSRATGLPTSHPVTVALTVGDDTGTTIVVRK